MEIIAEMSFKVYYDNLTTTEKTDLRDAIVPTYISYTSFYDKCRSNKFTRLEFEKLEQITNQKFAR